MFNDGQANFTRQGQLPDVWNNTNIALGDLNGDNAVDIVVGALSVRVYFKDGRGQFDNFRMFTQSADIEAHKGGIALADLNGDGYLDIFKANCCGGVAADDTRRWLVNYPAASGRGIVPELERSETIGWFTSALAAKAIFTAALVSALAEWKH